MKANLFLKRLAFSYPKQELHYGMAISGLESRGLQPPPVRRALARRHREDGGDRPSTESRQRPGDRAGRPRTSPGAATKGHHLWDRRGGWPSFVLRLDRRRRLGHLVHQGSRSEERRVGKEAVLCSVTTL